MNGLNTDKKISYTSLRRIIREKPEQMVSYERTLMDMNDTRELRTGMIAVVRWDEGKWSDVSVTDSSARDGSMWCYIKFPPGGWSVGGFAGLIVWSVGSNDIVISVWSGILWNCYGFDISVLRNVGRTWPVNSKEWNFEAEFYRCGLKIWMLLELFSLLFREHV